MTSVGEKQYGEMVFIGKLPVALAGIAAYSDDLRTQIGKLFERCIELRSGRRVFARFMDLSHADEIETSMMLVIAPATVDMKKAVKDYHPGTKGGLSRDPKSDAPFSTEQMKALRDWMKQNEKPAKP